MKCSNLEKGIFIMYKNEPHLVVERDFVSPGKGSAFVRLRLKNCITGAFYKDVIMKTNDSVDDADVNQQPAQYQYADDMFYHFMDNKTFEQYEIPRKDFSDKIYYMEDGENYDLIFWGEKPIGITIPKKKVFTVKDAPEVVKGDTATNVTKLITTTTGLNVKVPPFIKEGERILVNTETGEYVERVNK